MPTTSARRRISAVEALFGDCWFRLAREFLRDAGASPEDVREDGLQIPHPAPSSALVTLRPRFSQCPSVFLLTAPKCARRRTTARRCTAQGAGFADITRSGGCALGQSMVVPAWPGVPCFCVEGGASCPVAIGRGRPRVARAAPRSSGDG